MSIRKALTYSYHRNIGWQDRTIRTVVGLMALAGAAYFYQQPAVATGMVILFLAQVATVFSARCMICYFLGRCTITAAEKKSLDAKGIAYEGAKKSATNF